MRIWKRQYLHSSSEANAALLLAANTSRSVQRIVLRQFVLATMRTLNREPNSSKVLPNHSSNYIAPC